MYQKENNFKNAIRNIFKSDRKKSLKEAELELAKLRLMLKEAEYDVMEAELQVRSAKIELNQVLFNNK